MTKRKGSARDTLSRMRAAANRNPPTDPGDTVASPDSSAVAQSPRRAAEAAPRRKPGTMRYTIDLTPEERRKLHMFALDNGLSRHAAVMRTLIDLLDDPAVSDRVLDRIRAAKGA